MNGHTTKTRANAKALDFFSGKQQLVQARMDDSLLHQAPGFVDSKGTIHRPSDHGFDFHGDGSIDDVEGGADVSLLGSRCAVRYLNGLQGGIYEESQFHPSWTKFPLIYDKTHTQRDMPCTGGTYFSDFHSTLDLEDGTFLVIMQCWVFRLRQSDLLPVGEAPALRIVDGAAMKAAIEKAKNRQIKDAQRYLGQALDLRFKEADACRSGNSVDPETLRYR